MSTYYVLAPGSKHPKGPMPIEEIHKRLREGSITSAYLCCAPGATSWLPITSIIKQPARQDTPNQFMKPDNYLIWSIASALFCFPLAAFAIIKSSSVNLLWEQRKYEEAKQASSTALNCNIISTVFGVVIWITWLLLISLA